MATITLKSVSDKFPVGTVLGAYPDVGWLGTHPPPFAAATATGTVQADGSVTFANLSPSLNYRAGADMGGGIWRYVGFVTAPSTTGSEALEAPATDAVRHFSSNGDDANDGLSPGSAKQTLAAAINDLPAGPGRIEGAAGSIHQINATVSLRSDLTIDLKGATIQRAAGFGGALFNAASPVSRVVVENGRFDNGNSNNVGLLFANGSSEITFRRNRVTGHTGTFLKVNSGSLINSDVRVAANRFYGDTTVENQESVEVWNPYDCKITLNHFEGTGGVSVSTSQGAPSTCRHVHVRGNTFKQFRASGALIRTSGTTVLEDIVFSGNTGERLGSQTTQKGLAVIGEAVVTGSSGITRRVSVMNNTLRDFYGTGITCGGGTDGATCEDFEVVGNVMDAAVVDGVVDPLRVETVGIRLVGVNGFSIVANTVRNTARGGIRLLKSPNGSVTKNGSVIGNYIDSCVAAPTLIPPTADQEAGILLWDGCQDITIADNTVRNTTTVQNLGAGIGTGLYSTITGIRIHDNRCFDDRTPMLQEYGIRIGNAGSDTLQPTDIVVHDNDLRGNLTAAIKTFNTSGKNYVFHHNKDLTGLPIAPAAPDPLRRSAISSSSTMTATSHLYGVTDTTANRTITLPAISAVEVGHQVIVKDESGGAATHNITIVPQGADTIEGAASKVISANYDFRKFYSNGSQWLML